MWIFPLAYLMGTALHEFGKMSHWDDGQKVARQVVFLGIWKQRMNPTNLEIILSE
jgi:hypothetical protein